MTTSLNLDPSLDLGPDDGAEFDFDMQVIVSTARMAEVMCSTNDGCGSTCSTSACSTRSNDPL